MLTAARELPRIALDDALRICLVLRDGDPDRYQARISRALERRQQARPAAIIAISWKTQQRLHRLRRRLDLERGKRRTLVAVTITRHLAGFCWAIVTTTTDQDA